MPAMFSYPHRQKSGQITCYLNRTYHVLTTLTRVKLDIHRFWIYLVTRRKYGSCRATEVLCAAFSARRYPLRTAGGFWSRPCAWPRSRVWAWSWPEPPWVRFMMEKSTVSSIRLWPPRRPPRSLCPGGHSALLSTEPRGRSSPCVRLQMSLSRRDPLSQIHT